LLSVLILLQFACLYLTCSSVCNYSHVLNLESICLIPQIYIILHNVSLLTCSISYLLFLLWIYRTLNNSWSRKEDIFWEKSMYEIYDNISCFYLWLIQQQNQYSEHNTTIRSHKMGRYRFMHKTEDAKSQEQGSTNFPKFYWPHSNSGSQKEWQEVSSILMIQNPKVTLEPRCFLVLSAWCMNTGEGEKK
jgi:hypothetical protein